VVKSKEKMIFKYLKEEDAYFSDNEDLTTKIIDEITKDSTKLFYFI
jgi:hypothetical protein